MLSEQPAYPNPLACLLSVPPFDKVPWRPGELCGGDDALGEVELRRRKRRDGEEVGERGEMLRNGVGSDMSDEFRG